MTVASALPEQALRTFLRRRRKGSPVVNPLPLGHFLAETLDLCARLVPSQAGSLLLDDPTQPGRPSPLTFVAAFGPTADGLVGVRVPSGQGIVGHVYTSGETYATSCPADDPHFFGDVDESSEFRTRSIVAAPVRLEQTVCGVFELVNRRGRPSFSHHDVELVELVTQYVSRAILNAVDVLKHNELALRDDLTGLRNVRGLDLFLDQVVATAQQGERDVAVLFIDVDRLKALNDRLGHRGGSEALRRTARAIAEAVGDRGVPFRFGGDEFIVVCPETDIEAADQIAEDIMTAVRETTAGPMRYGGKLPGLTISVGVASLRASLAKRRKPGKTPPSARLLMVADKALYRAKRGGRDRAARAIRRDDHLGRGADLR